MQQEVKTNGTSSKPQTIYSNVKVSVKFLNKAIVCGVIALAVTMLFLSKNTKGFKVEFDTNGGSRIETQNYFYGEQIVPPAAPVKEGYRFKGWYIDMQGTQQWDFQKDKVQSSMVLFAMWNPK